MAYNEKTGMYEGYIYLIYNDVDDKKYIGQTSTLIRNRWADHKCAVKNTKRYNTAMYLAMREYGFDKFHNKEIEKIIRPSLEELIKELNFKEQYYIKYFHTSIDENGYNEEWGGRHDSKKVLQYNTNLEFLNIYKDLNEASLKTGIDKAAIRHVCSHDRLSTKGYVFCYEGDVPLDPTINRQIYKPMIFLMKDYYGNVLNQFNSTSEVSKFLNLKACKNGLLAAIRENRRYHGYYWEKVILSE